MPSINYPAKYVYINDSELGRKKFLFGGIGTDSASLDSSGLFFEYNGRQTLEFFCIMSKSRTHSINFLKGQEVVEKFPFYDFPINNGNYSVTAKVWNPLVFNDDVDSSIPAVFFEFEISNTSSDNLEMTFGAKLSSPFDSALCAEEESKDSVRVCSIFDTKEQHSVSISSSSKNTAVTFFESYALMGVPVMLSAGERKRVRFILSWYKKSDACPNYYTRYFDSSRECANYCFTHWKRLYEETWTVSELLYRSTFSIGTKKLFADRLSGLKGKNIIRNSAGFINGADKEFVPFVSHFFPRLDKKLSLRQVVRAGALESDDAFARLTGLYRALRFGSESSFIEHSWDDILDFIEYNFNNFELSEEDTLLSHSIISILAKINRDRRLFEKHKDGISNVNTFYNKVTGNLSDVYNRYRDIMGLDFDVWCKKIRLCPDMSCADTDVFVGALCFDGFLGFVERGIDYIQINAIKGRLTLREVEAPHPPLKVTCANINIGFTRDGNNAYFDNDCDVTPGRSIVVIFNS